MTVWDWLNSWNWDWVAAHAPIGTTTIATAAFVVALGSLIASKANSSPASGVRLVPENRDR
jgi:hypothetical protein